MPSGPLFPYSMVSANPGIAGPRVFDKAGALGEQMMTLNGSLSGDAVWRLRFQLPPAIPTGTCVLHLGMYANAVTGNARINPKWAGVAIGEDPWSVSLNAEGVQSVSWSTGDAYKRKHHAVTLQADSGGINAGELLIMDLTFETASWTLAVLLGVVAWIQWD